MEFTEEEMERISEESVPVGVIIGVVVASVFVILVGAISAVWWTYYRNKQRRERLRNECTSQ